MTPRRRRWFRYSLRTLFVAVTVLGVALVSCHWLWTQVSWKRARAQALESQFSSHWTRVDAKRGSPAPFGVRILGAPGYGMVTIFVKPFTSDQQMRETLQRFSSLFPEAMVRLDARETDINSPHGERWLRAHRIGENGFVIDSLAE
jgi:hypothetical protein